MDIGLWSGSDFGSKLELRLAGLRTVSATRHRFFDQGLAEVKVGVERVKFDEVRLRMQISTVICTHKHQKYLDEALASLLQQEDLACPLEIIVVVNSPDRIRHDELCARYASRKSINFLYTSVVGLSNARNIGAEAAHGEVVAYLDDDAVASPRWIRSLADAFDQFGSDAGIVGGPVKPIWVEPPPIWLTKRFYEIFSLVDRGDNIRVMEPHEWLAGCNIAFDRATLLSSGGFDAGLGRSGDALLSNEETAACDRIKESGKKMIFAPDALVRHIIPPGRATVEWVVRRIAWQAISDTMAFPQRSLEQAKFTARRWGFAARALQAFRYYRLLDKSKRSLSERDYQFIYDVVNQLLSGDRR